MGGPWRARGYDAGAWRPPRPHVEGSSEAGGPRDSLVGIAIGYILAVVTSVAMTLTFLKHGW